MTRNKVAEQKWTAERVEEGKRLHDLLDLAIDTDDDEMQKRHRLALQLWLGAAMQDGMFDILADAMRAASEPVAKAASCSTCGQPTQYPCEACGDCTKAGRYHPEAKAVPIERTTEKCVWCRHMEPHTLRNGDADKGLRGCSATGCDCDAYESRIRP
jgi:hypothetical protein